MQTYYNIIEQTILSASTNEHIELCKVLTEWFFDSFKKEDENFNLYQNLLAAILIRSSYIDNSKNK